MRKKILLSIGIFFLVIVLLVAGLLLFTQTQYFREFARIKTQNIVSSITGQKFSFSSLEGNFFTGIRFKDVSFEVEGESFVSAKEVSIDYALFHMLNSANLFSKYVPIDNLSITDLNVNLVKYPDGTWNFEKIGSGSEKKEGDKSSGPPAWTIILSEFLLTNANITVDDRAENKVAKYEIPEVDLSIKLIDIYRQIELDLKKASMNAPDQNLSISGLTTQASYSEDKVEVSDLSVMFNGAEINLNADAENLRDKPKFSLDASVKNYVIENIGTINLEAKGGGEYISSNDIRANATIDIPDSELLNKAISGTLEGITMSGTTIQIKGGNFASDLGKISLDGDIDLKRIITKEGNNSFDLTLKLDSIKTTEIFSLIESMGNDPSSLPVDTQLGAVLDSEINATGSWEEFSDLGVKADIKKFAINGKQAGDLQLSGTADYTAKSAGVDINLNLDKVNLGSILADMNYSSEITSKFDIKADVPLNGNLLENLSADVEGSFKPSSIFGINITDGAVDVSYEDQILDIKSLEINADKNKLVASGRSPEALGADFSYEIEVENLSFISGISPDLAVSGNLKASGDVTGSLKNPKITIDGEVVNFSFDEKYTAKSIKIDGSGTVSAQAPDLDASVDIETATIGTKEIESVNLSASSEGTAINADLDIKENEDFEYKLRASLPDLSSTQKDIQISDLVLKLEDTTLDNRDNILLTIAPGSYVLKNFNLYYNETSVLADANISENGNIDGTVKLNNLSLDDITKAFEFQYPVQGTINASVDIQGSKTNPAINTTIRTQDLEYKDFKNDEIFFSLNYLNQNLDLNFVISDNSADILTAKGNSTLNLNLNDVGKSLENADINMSIISIGLDLSMLSGITDEIVKSDGTLKIDLKASGKLTNPNLHGQINLEEGLIQTKTIRNEIGIPKALIVMTGQKATLQTLEMTTSNGSANFEGDLDIPSMTYNLSGTMDNLLIKPERISAAITGDLKVKGKGQEVDVSGKITVEKARITIPDKKPKELPEIQYVDVEPDEFTVDSGDEESYFDKNIALNLNINMKRNNWVRGQGANVELRGDLDIRKSFHNPIRIIGNIGVIRGTYENFGKVFRIQEGGTVSFSGREQIDPFLDITALYRVSDVNIYINIGGQVSEPKIELTSDPAMSETDIVSYLVFGASSTDISSGERLSVQGVATGLAGGIAAAQLERLMGNVVSLDVVSISGTNVEVGKYLTEDLYVAYERGTTDSIIDSSNITYNQVLVEYHIFNNITLDATLGGENPGVDLFYNFNF